MDKVGQFMSLNMIETDSLIRLILCSGAGLVTSVLTKSAVSVRIETSVRRPAREAVTKPVSTPREVTSVSVATATSSPLTTTPAGISTSAPGTTETAVTSVRTQVRLSTL